LPFRCRYNDNVGRNECSVVDTYWQTETGSIVITPLPGAIPTFVHHCWHAVQIALLTLLFSRALSLRSKPGSATFPFWGIEPKILDPTTGEELKGNDVEGVLCIKNSWPSERSFSSVILRFASQAERNVFCYRYGSNCLPRPCSIHRDLPQGWSSPPILHARAATALADLAVFMRIQPYPGYYFTGDGAGRDKDGYIWIKGRVDGMFLLFPALYPFPSGG
jgi:acetyl-CoA synthetase